MAGCLNKTDRRNGRTNILMLFVKVQALKYERKSIGAKNIGEGKFKLKKAKKNCF